MHGDTSTFAYWEELLLAVHDAYHNRHVTAPVHPMTGGRRHLCSPELGDHQATMTVLMPALRPDTARRPNTVASADCTRGNSSLEAAQLCQTPEANMGELSYCKHLRLKLNIVYECGHNAMLGGCAIRSCPKGVLMWVFNSALQSCCWGPAQQPWPASCGVKDTALQVILCLLDFYIHCTKLIIYC